jgi:phage-related protein
LATHHICLSEFELCVLQFLTTQTAQKNLLTGINRILFGEVDSRLSFDVTKDRYYNALKINITGTDSRLSFNVTEDRYHDALKINITGI